MTHCLLMMFSGTNSFSLTLTYAMQESISVLKGCPYMRDVSKVRSHCREINEKVATLL